MGRSKGRLTLCFSPESFTGCHELRHVCCFIWRGRWFITCFCNRHPGYWPSEPGLACSSYLYRKFYCNCMTYKKTIEKQTREEIIVLRSRFWSLHTCLCDF